MELGALNESRPSTSPYLLIDSTAPDVAHRYYRETNVTFTVSDYVGLTITGNVGSTNLIQYVEEQTQTIGAP